MRYQTAPCPDVKPSEVPHPLPAQRGAHHTEPPAPAPATGILEPPAQVEGRRLHRIPLHRIPILGIRWQQFVALHMIEESGVQRQIPVREQVAPLQAGTVVIAL